MHLCSTCPLCWCCTSSCCPSTAGVWHRHSKSSTGLTHVSLRHLLILLSVLSLGLRQRTPISPTHRARRRLAKAGRKTCSHQLTKPERYHDLPAFSSRQSADAQLMNELWRLTKPGGIHCDPGAGQCGVAFGGRDTQAASRASDRIQYDTMTYSKDHQRGDAHASPTSSSLTTKLLRIKGIGCGLVTI